VGFTGCLSASIDECRSGGRAGTGWFQEAFARENAGARERGKEAVKSLAGVVWYLITKFNVVSWACLAGKRGANCLLGMLETFEETGKAKNSIARR
jgi:hypothetical protein